MRSLLPLVASAATLIGLVMDPTSAWAQSTPIQYVVVIVGENVSFDHYFGTYPTAANPPGQPRFTAAPNTPTVNGLSPGLSNSNPNLNTANSTGAANPFRLNRNQALTAAQNDGYGPAQTAFHHGLLDLFPSSTGTGGGTPNTSPVVVTTTGLVMGHFDGNTVTAMWNYAQHYALNDNSYSTQFGSSTPGAINLISGSTNGIIEATATNVSGSPTPVQVTDGQGGYTLIGDADPLSDACSNPSGPQVSLSGRNVGNLLNAASLTWGWFQGGFDLTVTNPNGTTGCSRSTVSPITGLTEPDYVPHHAPFQYYSSTANPTHARPTAAIGFQDSANHQYDTHDFFGALAANSLPAVSFLKAPSYQDAHPGNSNPLDEQAFVVGVINALQQSPLWSATAVIVAYDEAGGWYDHQMGPLVNGSFASSLDSLTGASACGTAGMTPQLAGVSVNRGVNGRCGYGGRTPLLVISPWAKSNYVDNTVVDQTSILRFIEDNWNLGRIGNGSFDALANPLSSMFNLTQSTPQNGTHLTLSPITGLVQ